MKTLIKTKNLITDLFFKQNHSSPKEQKGFTMLEMLFVIGIFGILTAITIFNYGNFNKNVIMTNLAYEVALEIRQAQVYSLGTRRAGSATPTSGRSEFTVKYGVYFNTSQSGGDKSFVSFVDKWPQSNSTGVLGIPEPDGNGFCDADDALTAGECSISTCAVGSECLQALSLSLGITIDKLCVSEVDPVNLNNGECTDPALGKVDQLHITFARPYTDAEVKFSSSQDPDKKYNAGIVMKSTGGSKRAVIVKNTGQISVEFINN
ncbi:MAG TPA: type II secretion system protein [Candidatus Paceibacterota bacterium]|nr:type II secretion system protein [Candidatus Paceibacterota bacterium]HMP19161.1 type II secretion system protein [Candidatus Paceibacterota bacterium]HMP85212.1 type II secretion system protein [Candidatus Paceibacterota bacterium]